MTIEALLFAGALAGFAVGLVAPKERYGCFMLLTVPIGAFAYVWVWQWQNPESLRSTSGLDFLFGPLWPSIGAAVGYVVGRLLRAANAMSPKDKDS